MHAPDIFLCSVNLLRICIVVNSPQPMLTNDTRFVGSSHEIEDERN